jgi:predicted permease
MKMERWWFTAPLRFKSIFRRRMVESEMDEELAFHVDQKTEEGIAAGLSREEARAQAVRAMGGLDQRREEIRDARRVNWLTDFAGDVKYAVRSLRRTPGLAVFVIVTIALGIGMTATPFSMLDALVFRPYPVPQPGRVVSLVSTTRDDSLQAFSYPEYRDIQSATTSYEGVVASGSLVGVGVAADAGATPRVRGAQLVSGNYFRVLGVEPAVGRVFRDDEDQVPGRDAVVVLGPDIWKNEFSADPSVVGRVIRVNGVACTVVGVAPESFPGMLVFSRPDLYLPLSMARVLSADTKQDFFTDREARGLVVRGRLRPGVAVEDAHGELVRIARDFEREYPALNRERGAAVRTQFEIRTRGEDMNWKFGVIFTVLALAVLLVACTNVAGLLLSRARSRTREVAVRLALGAGRFRLIRMLLTESLVLALLGGLGGIIVGYLGIGVLQRFRIPAELPVTVPFRMDVRVLTLCLAISVASAIACGLAPALQSTRTNLVNGLKAADVDAPGRKRLWARNALVVAQVSISLMLLAAAFFMYRGFHEGIREGTGFAKDNLLMARFDPRLVQYDATQTRQFYEQLTRRVRDLTGVESTGLTVNPPLTLDGFGSVAFVPEGFQMPPQRKSFSSKMDTVDEGFFATMGIPILRGRAFSTSDSADSPRVAIINQQFANHFWPNGDALGKRIRLERATGAPVAIVGIAQTIKYEGTSERPQDFVYLPLSQNPVPRLVLMARTSGDPLQYVEPVKDIVRTLDANLPISEMRTFEDLYRYHSVDGPAVAVRLVGTLGLVGLLLATAGLYGVIAYNVSRRTREIGIRMAIGARPADVLLMVMRKGLVLVGIGAAIGLAMGFAIERLMNAMLFRGEGVDVLVYLVVVPTMILVTMLAAYVPARRASRIAPTQALYCE